MGERATITRASEPGRQRGTWWIVGKLGPVMMCPECGQLGRLDTHQIDDSGIVDPSVACPAPGCDFHTMVQLDGWQGREGE